MTSKAKTDPGHKEGLILVGALSLILIVAIDWAVSINHQLVVQEQGINEKWAQVLNIYQRRADLLPTLVEKVKSVAIQERAVAEDVTTARTRAGVRSSTVGRPGVSTQRTQRAIPSSRAATTPPSRAVSSSA